MYILIVLLDLRNLKNIKKRRIVNYVKYDSTTIALNYYSYGYIFMDDNYKLLIY